MGAFLTSVLGPAAFSASVIASLTLTFEPGSTDRQAPSDSPQVVQFDEVEAPVAHRPDVEHVPPVDAPVTDPFRAPEHDFGPGNRGIEYGTTVGDEVVASAPGTVSFAGSVAGSLFVSVDHGGGLITTVGFLDEVSVSGGDVIAQGDVLGRAGERTHFSSRQDGVYFDPERLFEVMQIIDVSVRLVAGPG